MPEIILNEQLANLLVQHGITVTIGSEFIQTDLPDGVKFKARAIYDSVRDNINSRLDIMALTDRGEKIIESFGDIGNNVEDAVKRNFQSFAAGSLHPLLAGLGCLNTEVYEQVTIEEWEINQRMWKVYIGVLVPKSLANGSKIVHPPEQFFQAIEAAIRAQTINNRLHWFRGYYCQYQNEITHKELLMDNDELADVDTIFGALPVIPGMTFYSCRNFVVLKCWE